LIVRVDLSSAHQKLRYLTRRTFYIEDGRPSITTHLSDWKMRSAIPELRSVSDELRSSEGGRTCGLGKEARAYQTSLRSPPSAASKIPIGLTPAEFDDLITFVADGLLDERVKPEYLCKLVPGEVPSGLAVLRSKPRSNVTRDSVTRDQLRFSSDTCVETLTHAR
jgi:hypothetical protein